MQIAEDGASISIRPGGKQLAERRLERTRIVEPNDKGRHMGILLIGIGTK
jgi:hypothetical protein